MLGKCSTIDLHSQPKIYHFSHLKCTVMYPFCSHCVTSTTICLQNVFIFFQFKLEFSTLRALFLCYARPPSPSATIPLSISMNLTALGIWVPHVSGSIIQYLSFVAFFLKKNPLFDFEAVFCIFSFSLPGFIPFCKLYFFFHKCYVYLCFA